jgi:hypothetical protein
VHSPRAADAGGRCGRAGGRAGARGAQPSAGDDNNGEEDDDATATVVEPVKMRDSHVAAVHGRHVAARAGVYTLVWDNTHSFLKGKNLSYAADLHLPSDDAATTTGPDDAAQAPRTESTASLTDGGLGSSRSGPVLSQSAPL